MKKFLSMFAIGLLSVNIASAEEISEPEKDSDSDKKIFEDADEIQLEYLLGNSFNQRHVNNYNVHFFEKVTDNGVMSYWRGLTFTRAVGYTNPKKDGGVHHESNGVGLGAAFMLRWDKKVSGKFHAGADFTGSFMLYNKAHPYDGRAYGFLWRLGPRLTWQSREDDSFSIGYSISHFSNGMRKHNPGYNTLGFSVGYTHSF
ncbi:MAG: acyloxyacyl hydrolase [Selenomonadaceae bacterium]|nr:acyloxyacyl hydrolase [Selenomonadaceae bacterium]